jgi:hypothetical protein
MKFIPWHEDKWLSREGRILPYDKLEHFLLALLWMIVGILLLKISLPMVILIGVAAAIGWEIKDGLFSHGFSWKDLIADFAGLAVGYLVAIIF